MDGRMCVCGGGGSKRRFGGGVVRGRTVDIIAVSGTRQTITSHSTTRCDKALLSNERKSNTYRSRHKWLMVKMRKENNHLLHSGSCDKTSLHTVYNSLNTDVT